MRFCTGRKAAMLLAVLTLACAGTDAASYAQRPLPNPVLFLEGVEYVKTGGKEFIRYHFAVENSSAYPDTMFAASPELPPCGQNTKASRTWVDVYAQDGK